jgi:hypothetical protein
MMADVAIDDLGPASTLDGSEIAYVVQGGNSRRTTTGDIAALVIASGIAYEPLTAGDLIATTVQDAIEELDAEKVAKAAFPVTLIVAVSDETTALTTGTAKITFRMAHAMTLTEVRASLTIAQASGSILTVDINESGTTILSTKLTIDNTEKTSTTAATAAVISDADLADDAEITIDIDAIGDGSAEGLKVTLIGTRVI